MAQPTLSNQLAEHVAAVGATQLTPEVLAALRRSLVDFLGVAAASSTRDFAQACVRVAARLGNQPECTVIGSSTRLPAASAALVHGTLGHGLDFDDTHLPSLSHLTSTVLSAVLGVSEATDASGSDLLAAFLVGVEVGGRLGRAVSAPEWRGSAVRAQGFFATSALGTIAAGSGAARALGMNAEQIARVISLAANFSCGLAEIAKGDNWGKRSQPGWAAHAGVCAALLVEEGYAGPRLAFEGEHGFFAAFSGGHFKPEVLREPWGARWECSQVSLKRYPVEHYIQPLLELAERCRAEVALQPEAITEVQASVSSQIHRGIFLPQEAKVNPPNAYAAQMSAPYCLARALTKPAPARLTLDDFGAGFVNDAAVQALGAKIRFVPEPDYDEVFPEPVPGRLRLLAGRHVLWEGSVADVSGSPRLPMSETELIAKFHTNGTIWSAPQRERVMQTVCDLTAHRTRDLVRALE